MDARKRLLKLLAVGLMLLPLTGMSAARRPNIVLFLVDDMGWLDSGVYGSKYYETPHMDRLATQAMRFTDAYALPLCSPSRASILTGQYSSRHRVTSASGHRPPAPAGASPYPAKAGPGRRLLYASSRNCLDPELVTIAEVLRGAGYRTGHFGKWHLGLMPQHWPDKQGFETTWHCAPDPGPPSYFSPYGVHAEGRPTGKHKVGTTSDAIVGCIDLYPTILEVLGLSKPAGHIVDGVSILPVLKQTGTLNRGAFFTWFPHLIPAVSVRQGDWKLIRRFEPHRDYPEIRELYDLKNDIGETTNLAKKMPDKVKQFDALIDGFVKDTGALTPKPNPAYRPPSLTAGLVARMCKMSLVDGVLRVEGNGRTPFLGTAQVRHTGPMALKIRARTAAGGVGKVQWKTANQDGFPKEGQVAEFTVPAGTEWQDVTVALPVKGKAAIVRLYLPAQKAPVEIQSLKYFPSGSGKPIRTWDFGRSTPR